MSKLGCDVKKLFFFLGGGRKTIVYVCNINWISSTDLQKICGYFNDNKNLNLIN